MSLIELARLGLIELWRRGFALYPLAVFGFLSLMLVAEVHIGGFDLGGHDVLRTPAGYFATQLLPVAGELAGLLAGASALAGEFERGTVLLLATKMPRWSVVVGKALGVYLFMLAVFAGWTAVLVFGWLATGDPRQTGTLIAAGMLGVLPGLLIASLALAFSARFASSTALGASLVLMIARFIAGGALQSGAIEEHPAWLAIARALTYAIPSDRLVAVGPALLGVHPLLLADGLALLAPLAWLLVAIGLFWQRDLTAQS